MDIAFPEVATARVIWKVTAIMYRQDGRSSYGRGASRGRGAAAVLAFGSTATYVSFDEASASSTRASAFASQQAIAPGDGVCCSAGNHDHAQIVRLTGFLEAPVQAERL